MKTSKVTLILRKTNYVAVMLALVLVQFPFGSDSAFAQTSSPSFDVNVSNNSIDAYGWGLNTLVQLSIDDNPDDDPEIDPEIDYEDAKMVEVASWDPNATNARFKLVDFELRPGQYIKMTGFDGDNNPVTKTHTVYDIVIDNVDILADTVSGQAASSDQIEVWVDTPSGQNSRWVIRNENLTWTADFSVEGSGNSAINISPESRVGARQRDVDRDATVVRWRAQLPKITVYPEEDRVEGEWWLLGWTVTVKIYDPKITPETPDYEGNTLVVYTPYSTDQTYFNIKLGNYDLKPYDKVVVSYSEYPAYEKEHIVTSLDVDDTIDPITDIVSGTAEINSIVDARICREDGCVFRTVSTGQDGHWSANFGVAGEGEVGTFDIVPGTHGGAQQCGDGSNDVWDCTQVNWDVPRGPTINVFPIEQRVVGKDWPEGATVTMIIDDPDTLEEPEDYSDAQTAVMQEDGRTQVLFDLVGKFTLETKQVVTMRYCVSEGNCIEKKHKVSLEITLVDRENDIVQGKAEAGDVVAIFIGEDENWRFAETNDDEIWVADFKIPVGGVTYDLDYGTQVSLGVRDADDDSTSFSWYIAPDIDNDGKNDLMDPCPGDYYNLCDPNGSVAGVIGINGGTIASENGKITLSVPDGAMDYLDSLSITDMGGGYEIVVDQGTMTVIYSYAILPHSTQFDPPANITFRWDDSDNDGIVDGTTLNENQILIIKDELVITPSCSINPDCDMVANELTIYVSDLSLFALAVPVEWTLKGFYQPVDMNGVYNLVKGGSTVPLKFEIFAGPTELIDVASVKSLTYAQTSCDANAITDEIETTATGGTSLRYADGQFIYNWKTPKTAGKCYRVTMTTIDSSSLVAYFKLK